MLLHGNQQVVRTGRLKSTRQTHRLRSVSLVAEDALAHESGEQMPMHRGRTIKLYVPNAEGFWKSMPVARAYLAGRKTKAYLRHGNLTLVTYIN